MAGQRSVILTARGLRLQVVGHLCVQCCHLRPFRVAHHPLDVPEHTPSGVVVRRYYECGECRHEDTFTLSQRLSFVPGQGWTI